MLDMQINRNFALAHPATPNVIGPVTELWTRLPLARDCSPEDKKLVGVVEKSPLASADTLIHDLSKLRYYPPKQTWARIRELIINGQTELNLRSAANILHAYAKLSCKPPDEIFVILSDVIRMEAIGRTLNRSDEISASRILWAYAVLDLPPDEELFEALTSRLSTALLHEHKVLKVDPSRFHDRKIRESDVLPYKDVIGGIFQLHQASLWYKDEVMRYLPPVLTKLNDHIFRKELVAGFEIKRIRKRKSTWQNVVEQSLRLHAKEHGATVVLEAHLTEPVDVGLRCDALYIPNGGGAPVAIEIDGPSHYSRELCVDPFRPLKKANLYESRSMYKLRMLGSTLLRNRLFDKHHGKAYARCYICYNDWELVSWKPTSAIDLWMTHKLSRAQRLYQENLQIQIQNGFR